MPMCLPLIRQIQQIHPWTEIDSVQMQPILNLIVTHCSDGKMSSSTNKGLFVVSRKVAIFSLFHYKIRRRYRIKIIATS